MITSPGGEFVAECDECGMEEYGGTIDTKSQDGFKEFVQQLKELGWRIRKEDDQWCHYCEDCKNANGW